MMGATPLWLRLTFTFMLIVLIGAGVLYYLEQKEQLGSQAKQDLLVVARAKQRQIEHWRAERLDDGAAISESAFLAEAVRRWMGSTEQDSNRIRTRLAALRKRKDFHDVLLVDNSGKILLSVREQSGAISSSMVGDLQEAIRTRGPVLSDLHRRDNEPPHMDVIAPLVYGSGPTAEVVGAVLLQIDAEQFLYPLIQEAPAGRRTAETLLVHQEGNEVVFLNKLRHQEIVPLRYRLPLDGPTIAARAISNPELMKDVIEGVDYRDEPVLAVATRIEGSPWYMISKVDRSEALSAWQRRATRILVAVGGLTLLMLGFIGTVWQRNSKQHYQELYQAERARRKSEERFRTTLLSVGDGVIATDGRGNVELLNPVAQALTGWTPQEAEGKPVDEVFRIINEESRKTVESPVHRVLREGVIVGLANHTLLVARDGVERPIADSGAPIREADGQTQGVVLVFRDQTHEREARRKVESSEARYRQLFSQMQSGAALHEIICDADGKPVDYRFLEVNPAFEALTGLQRDKIVGKTVREILPGVENRWVETYGRVALTGEPTRFEEYSGALNKHYEVIAYSPQRGQFAAIFSDVTQRKQSEAEIKRINRMLRTISDCNQTLVRSTNEQTLLDEICRIITGVGGFFFACVSAPQDDEKKTLIALSSSGPGKEFFDVANVTWSDTPRGGGPTGSAVRTGKPCIVQDTQTDPLYAPWRELARKHGYRSTVALPLVSEGKTFGALTIAAMEKGAFTPQEMLLLEELAGDLSFGITALRHEADRLATHERLRLSEERYRALVENVNVGITWIDGDYRIRAANAQQGRWYNLPSQDLIGRKCHEVFESRSHVCAHCPGTAALCTGQPTVAEIEGNWDQGRRRFVRLHAYPVLSKQGNPEGFIEVAEDITAQKEAAQTLQAMEQQLAHAQRMEAIGQLAGGVAHDFRNQLTVIRGFAEMLSRRNLVVGDGPQMLAEILKAADRSASLTAQLLAFSRKQALAPKVLDLRELVTGIARIAPRVIEENVHLKVLVLPDPIFAEIDPGQFEQALLNLISNARDAMPNGGDLHIEACAAGPEDDVSVRHADAVKGPYVRLTIRDTGCGMDQATLARIFEPFFTTKPVGVGTGLGLSMVYGFVKQSSGIIEVQSELGKGTTFRLYFPRIGAPPSADGQNGANGHAPSGHEKVLLVEDEPAVRKMLTHSLREAGYEVLDAGNVQEAMRVVQEGKLLDLLITDVVMPGGDGISLAEGIQKTRPELPVVFLSGYPDPDMSRRATTGQRITILTKPVDHKSFLKAVRAALDGK